MEIVTYTRTVKDEKTGEEKKVEVTAALGAREAMLILSEGITDYKIRRIK